MNNGCAICVHSQEAYGVIDVSSPDSVSPADRKRLRHTDESKRFNADQYLADLYDDDGSVQVHLDYMPQCYNIDKENGEWKVHIAVYLEGRLFKVTYYYAQPSYPPP